MGIHELTTQASRDALARTSLGRLACCRGMQPYVVPIHFAYQNDFLYSFSMPGQKIDWMRANPLVCVEADHLRREDWTTVVVFGRYEELSDTAEMSGERAMAVGLLRQRAAWWKPGSLTIARGGTPSAPVPVFYRIVIAQITGRRATLEAAAPGAGADRAERGWLHKALQRVRRS